ncbi:hypothetical protein [Olleya marilimosa]|uniref:hypothetical protein n=1 Tax=Olleya marilimosa TaxID=272164 RepID=UPI0030EB7ADC|tara:strand:+ start:99777 stop:100073 length:297 start_codon:yes stop_codon:yes gene_type:complete
MKEIIKNKLTQLIGFIYLNPDVDVLEIEIFEGGMNISYFNDNGELVFIGPESEYTGGYIHRENLSSKGYDKTYDALGVDILTEYYFDTYDELSNKKEF